MERLRNERIIQLSFSPGVTISEGDEIRVNGKMMDVQSVIFQTNRTLVYAWPDAEEESLQQEIDAIASQQKSDNDNDEAFGKAVKFFQLNFHSPAVFYPVKVNSSATNQLYPSLITYLPIVHLPVATPPPIIFQFS